MKLNIMEKYRMNIIFICLFAQPSQHRWQLLVSRRYEHLLRPIPVGHGPIAESISILALWRSIQVIIWQSWYYILFEHIIKIRDVNICRLNCHPRSERPTHDMADVLLSLKHVVHKPSADTLHPHHGHSQNGVGQHHPPPSAYANHGHQASVSYTVHPHQMLCSSSPSSIATHPHQQQMSSGNTGYAPTSSGGYYDSPCSGAHPAQLYPSMSVNVSMNMTMHGYGVPPEANMPMQCSQVQWTPQTPASSSVNVLYPPLLSPNHYPSGATYSFTADFRPPAASTQAQQSMMDTIRMPPEPISSPSRPSSYYQSNMVEYSPPRSPNYTQVIFLRGHF